MGSQTPQVGMIGYFRRRVSQPDSGFSLSPGIGKFNLVSITLGFRSRFARGYECDKKTRCAPMCVAIPISLPSTSAVCWFARSVLPERAIKIGKSDRPDSLLSRGTTSEVGD